jgi:hypothetical protein
MRAWLVLAALVVACTVACTKEGADKPSSRDGVIAAWKKAGLEPSAFTPATTPVGKDCASGTVNKLDVLVCVFGTEQEAKAAEDPGFAWIGDATGTSRAQGSTLIVVADRRKADPSGRTINQLVTLRAK